LVVEDDDALAEGLSRHLRRAGFEVERVADGDEARAMSLAGFDLAVLDLMLPGTYGLDVLKAWRARGDEGALPVVLLTARDHTADKVRGLSLGADDYVTKPFHPEELIARLRARLRRAKPAATDTIVIGPLSLDREARVVRLEGAELDLAPIERAILFHLGERAGRAIARADLAEAVLDRDDERGLDAHVSRLRKKLGTHAGVLATVWGIGYRLEAPRGKAG
jgi:two-component system response regulator MtrA